MAQKFYCPRETRSLSRLLNNKRSDITSNNDSPKAPQKTPKQLHKRKPVAKMAEPYNSMASQLRSDDSSDGLDEKDSAAGSAIEGSSDNDEDDESEVFAPSDHANQRMGHQTGLSKTQDQVDDCDSAGDLDDSSLSSVSECEAGLEQIGFDDDDDNYQGVDSISGLEEDDPEVERLEEDMIIESMEVDETVDNRLRNPTGPFSREAWPGYNDADHMFTNNDIPVLFQIERRSEQLTFDDLFAETNADEPYVHPEFRSSPTAPQRRVRFADEIDGQALFEEADSIEFGRDTDTFVLREHLSDRLARIIDDDDDGGANILHDIGSCDVPQHNDLFARRVSCSTPGPTGALTPTESSVQSGFGLEVSGGYSSGYETDEGEETDDVIIPPATINRPHTLLRLHSNSSVSKAAAPTRVTKPRRGKVSKRQMRRRAPRLGSFKLNTRNPVAYFNSSGKFKQFFKGLRSPKTRYHLADVASSASSSIPPSPHVLLTNIGDMFAANQVKETMRVGEEVDDRIISTGTTSMIPDLLQTTTKVRHIHSFGALGPVEPFFSLSSPVPEDLVAMISDQDMSDNDAGEGMLDVADFIDFGDSSSDDDTAVIKPLSPSSSQENWRSAVSYDKVVNDPFQNLLGHFDTPFLVTAFRRNQDRHSAGTRYAYDDPVPRALKGPRLGAFSISPKSPIKNSVRQRKEKMRASRARSSSCL